MNITYQEAIEFIQQTMKYGSVLGLQTISELLRRLDNPQEHLKIIHVAGTNGKGSTTSFISYILAAAGYQVGRYNSPAVFTYREMIQILKKNNADKTEAECISEQGVCDTIAMIKPACEAMVKEGFPHPTSFEIETAIAMLYLYWQKVDIAVIEVGLGGRMDATNVIAHPLCSVITSISMDHMQYLGDTLSKIATEKAGIIKKGAPVITGLQESEVMEVLQQVCMDIGTELTISEFDHITQVDYATEGTKFTLPSGNINQSYTISLLGDYQVSNALIALTVIKKLVELGYSIDDTAIHSGFGAVRWSGRFELISKKPYFIIDGAHNKDAAEYLHSSLMKYFQNRRFIYIIGVLADKDYKSILHIMAPMADVIITLTPDNSRALSSSELRNEAEQYGKKLIDAGDVTKALTAAYQEANEEDVIVAFGSLSFMGDLKKKVHEIHEIF